MGSYWTWVIFEIYGNTQLFYNGFQSMSSSLSALAMTVDELVLAVPRGFRVFYSPSTRLLGKLLTAEVIGFYPAAPVSLCSASPWGCCKLKGNTMIIETISCCLVPFRPVSEHSLKQPEYLWVPLLSSERFYIEQNETITSFFLHFN